MKTIIVFFFALMINTKDKTVVKYQNHSHFKTDYKKYAKAITKLKEQIADSGSRKIMANRYSEIVGDNSNDLILIKLLNQNVEGSDHVIVIFKVGNLRGSIKDGLRIILKDEDLVKGANVDNLIKDAGVLDNNCPLPIYKPSVPEDIEYCTTFMKSAEKIVRSFTKAESLGKENGVKSCIEKHIVVKQPTYKYKCFKSGLTVDWEVLSKNEFQKNTKGLTKNENGEFTKLGTKTQEVTKTTNYKGTKKTF